MTPIASEAIRAALKGHDPTPEQWEAISHPLEPAHLIAGAGAGKTAVMAARIAWIIESGRHSPAEILGLTFTNKAADELADRVRLAISKMDEHRPEEVTVQTYHAFAAGIVRDHGLLVGVEPDAGLLSEAQQWQMVLSCLDDLPAFEAIELRSYATLVRNTLALASSIADHMISVADVEAAADGVLASRASHDREVQEAALKRKELCRAVAAYTELKRRRQRIDFGDQVTKAVEILTHHPEVRDSYRERFPIVLLDEYQDTNVAQRILIQQLIGENGAVTAVGDARQAIYAFRGATMYNLIGFPEDFPRTDGALYEAVSLSENFRSGDRILQVANRVIDPIPEERRPGLPLKAQTENGAAEVSLGLFTDQGAEAVWIARRCDELHGEIAADGRDPIRWKDIAILVRTKSHMDALLRALEEHDIPVEVVDLGGLLKTPEVTEVVAWLRALETKPSANRWIARVLLGPRFRIHYRDLSLCARWASERNHDLKLRLAGGDEEAARDMEPGDVAFSLAEALSHVDEIEGLGDEARTRIGRFVEKLDALRVKTAAPLLELVQEVIHQSGVAEALDASGSRAAPAAKQNLSNLLDYVAMFSPLDGHATLRSFLAYLDAAEDAEETLEATQPAEQDSVKLMTVHAAKGLEFECVFVPSVAAGKSERSGEHIYSVFPNTRASDPLTSYVELPYEIREDSHRLPQWKPGENVKKFAQEVRARGLEDERRLFYVALTRAKQRLAITASWWYGRGKLPKGPSLFWDELRPLVDEGLVNLIAQAEFPEENPILEELEARRDWPPVARAGRDDQLFPEGWGTIADAYVANEINLNDLRDRLDDSERSVASAELARHAADLDAVAAVHRPDEESAPRVPEIVSATAFIRLEDGTLTVWDLVRPLPERPTSARRIGTEIHRIIEERSRGISTYPEETELDEPTAVEDSSDEDGGVIRSLVERYETAGFAQRRLATLPSGEPMVELPFTLKRKDTIIRGRIDAVYESDDGGLEIVDFKTGRRFEIGEIDQLGLYAEALEAMGLLPTDRPVRLTYAFLDGEPPLTRIWREGPGEASQQSLFAPGR